MTKEWLSFSGQVARLSTRGLRVEDADQAQAFLSVTNYYRFSGYFRAIGHYVCLKLAGSGLMLRETRV